MPIECPVQIAKPRQAVNAYDHLIDYFKRAL